MVEFEKLGGAAEVVLLALAALDLDVAELLERFQELPAEALAVHTQGGEGAMGVDDIEIDGGLLVGRILGAMEQLCFEQRDAVLTPGSVGELVDQVRFGGSGRTIFLDELLHVAIVGVEVFGGEHGGVSSEAVGERVL